MDEKELQISSSQTRKHEPRFSNRLDAMNVNNFVLPSEEDFSLVPEENLEPNSAVSKSLRTREVLHKSLEESHAAQIRERSLLDHIVCPEETQRKILESDIFRILESDGVTRDRRSVQSFPFKVCLGL